MGIFRSLFDLFKKPNETQKEYEARVIEEADAIRDEINAQLYAECVVINFIAKWFALSKVIFFENKERQKKSEYYRWNVKPNAFQTGYELKYDFAVQVLLHSEALIFDKFDKDLFVADSFQKTRKGLNGYTFTDIEKDDEKLLDIRNSADSLYVNYETNEIRRRLSYLLSGLQSLINSAADNYNISAYQKGVLEIDNYEEGDNEFQKKLDDLLNNRFRQFFKSKKNSVLPIYKGFKYIDINNDRSSTKKSEIADIKNTVDDMIAKAAIAHGIKPSAIIGDKADISNAEKSSIIQAVKPIAELLEQAINGSEIISEDRFIKGKYCKVDLTPLVYSTPFDSAEASDMLFRSSQYSVDELRELRGDEPIGAWWSKRYFGIENYKILPDTYEEYMQGIEGGDKQNGKSDKSRID